MHRKGTKSGRVSGGQTQHAEIFWLQTLQISTHKPWAQRLQKFSRQNKAFPVRRSKERFQSAVWRAKPGEPPHLGAALPPGAGRPAASAPPRDVTGGGVTEPEGGAGPPRAAPGCVNKHPRAWRGGGGAGIEAGGGGRWGHKARWELDVPRRPLGDKRSATKSLPSGNRGQGNGARRRLSGRQSRAGCRTPPAPRITAPAGSVPATGGPAPATLRPPLCKVPPRSGSRGRAALPSLPGSMNSTAPPPPVRAAPAAPAPRAPTAAQPPPPHTPPLKSLPPRRGPGRSPPPPQHTAPPPPNTHRLRTWRGTAAGRTPLAALRCGRHAAAAVGPAPAPPARPAARGSENKGLRVRVVAAGGGHKPGRGLGARLPAWGPRAGRGILRAALRSAPRRRRLCFVFPRLGGAAAVKRAPTAAGSQSACARARPRAPARPPGAPEGGNPARLRPLRPSSQSRGAGRAPRWPRPLRSSAGRWARAASASPPPRASGARRDEAGTARRARRAGGPWGTVERARSLCERCGCYRGCRVKAVR